MSKLVVLLFLVVIFQLLGTIAGLLALGAMLMYFGSYILGSQKEYGVNFDTFSGLFLIAWPVLGVWTYSESIPPTITTGQIAFAAIVLCLLGLLRAHFLRPALSRKRSKIYGPQKTTPEEPDQAVSS